MKRKKKILMSVTAGVILLVTLILLATSALAAVSVGTRNTTNMFDYNGGSGWNDLKTPEHYIVGTSPEQVAYCLQHRNDSPSNSSYNDSDILGTYSARVQTGLRIIFENGYPYGTGGLTATEARYATANAVRFWLSENGDSGQYNFTNLGSYSDSQLRSAAASGTIGSKIRANSGYTDVLQFAIELLIKARSQSLMTHNVTLSTPSMSISGSYSVGTSWVTLTNMNGGYVLNTSGLPSGSSVSGYTGQSGDTLTIRIPVSEANANRNFSLSATGRDNRTRSNMFAYAPTNSSLQQRRLFHDTKPLRNSHHPHCRANSCLCDVLRIDSDGHRQKQPSRHRHLDVFQVDFQNVHCRTARHQHLQHYHGDIRRGAACGERQQWRDYIRRKHRPCQHIARHGNAIASNGISAAFFFFRLVAFAGGKA